MEDLCAIQRYVGLINERLWIDFTNFMITLSSFLVNVLLVVLK